MADAIWPAAPELRRPRILRQRWLDLTFLHWAVEPADVAHFFPPGTRPDTFEGRTYVGLVPFRMVDTGLPHGPAVPYVGTFLETNVRLYSVDESGRRGVVFLSLDANRLAVVTAARTVFGLPYRWARMTHTRDGNHHTYTSTLRWPGVQASATIDVEVGARLELGPARTLPHRPLGSSHPSRRPHLVPPQPPPTLDPPHRPACCAGCRRRPDLGRPDRAGPTSRSRRLQPRRTCRVRPAAEGYFSRASVWLTRNGSSTWRDHRLTSVASARDPASVPFIPKQHGKQSLLSQRTQQMPDLLPELRRPLPLLPRKHEIPGSMSVIPEMPQRERGEQLVAALLTKLQRGREVDKRRLGRALQIVGNYTGIERSHPTPTIIRRLVPKPLRPPSRAPADTLPRRRPLLARTRVPRRPLQRRPIRVP